jgi:hypothetical protein
VNPRPVRALLGLYAIAPGLTEGISLFDANKLFREQAALRGATPRPLRGRLAPRRRDRFAQAASCVIASGIASAPAPGAAPICAASTWPRPRKTRRTSRSASGGRWPMPAMKVLSTWTAMCWRRCSSKRTMRKREEDFVLPEVDKSGHRRIRKVLEQGDHRVSAVQESILDAVAALPMEPRFRTHPTLRGRRKWPPSSAANRSPRLQAVRSRAHS